MGGELIRRWTSLAPASRIILTILRLVVPRTIESSMTTTRLPSRRLCTGCSLRRTPKVANRLGRLDEGAADVVASDQPELEGEPGGFGVPERCGDAAIRHRNDDVGFDRLVLAKGAAHALSGVVDADPVERSVGPGEVDVLEDAHVSPLGVVAKRAGGFAARTR